MERRHGAQWLSRLELSGCHVGLPIDFNVKLLKEDIRRLVNELKEYDLCARGVLCGKFNTSSFLRNRPLRWHPVPWIV
jgi:hypothetical protein